METKLTRRSILNLGTAVGGLAVGGSVLGAANIMSATKPSTALPWTWKEIKPDDVIKERAYQSAWAKIGCMYGTIEAVIGTLADKYGAPYNTFPVDATVYGSGGIAGVGSLCGAVNACGLLFNLFSKNQEDLFALCQEVSLWYENAELPVYKPKKPKVEIPDVSSVAHSNLCHISSTAWANASGQKLLTQEHFERCNRLVSDVTAKVVAMLNEYTFGKVTFKEKLNAFSQGCLSCHGPGKVKANVAAGMNCDTCHENPH
jgi:hypothetical protein